MKKLLLIAAVFTLLFSLSANATETRTLVMGENNMIMMDDANVWLFPSRINNYGNLATAEFSWDDDDMYNFGINWKFNDDNPWVLGTYFSTEGDASPYTYTGVPLFSSYFYDAPGAPAYYGPALSSRSLDLLYGRNLGGFLFGFGFGLNNSSYTSEAENNDAEASFSQYIFSLGLTSQAGTWDVAAHIGLGNWTNKDPDGEEISEPDGYSDIMVLGRYFHKYNQTITFVPHASVHFGSRGATYNQDVVPGAIDYKESRTAFELGAGMNYTPVTNVLAVIDLGFQYEKIKAEEAGADDENLTTTRLPYFRVGLEGEVFSWMDARFGVVSNWERFKFEDSYKSTYFDNQTYLGIGLNFNRLHLDTYMDPEIVLDGFNFISGSDEVDDLNFKVSALYELF